MLNTNAGRDNIMGPPAAAAAAARVLYDGNTNETTTRAREMRAAGNLNGEPERCGGGRSRDVISLCFCCRPGDR